MKILVIFYEKSETFLDHSRFYYKEVKSTSEVSGLSVDECTEHEFLVNDCVLKKMRFIDEMQDLDIGGKLLSDYFKVNDIPLWQYVVSELYSNEFERYFIFVDIMTSILNVTVPKKVFIVGQIDSYEEALVSNISKIYNVVFEFENPPSFLSRCTLIDRANRIAKKVYTKIVSKLSWRKKELESSIDINTFLSMNPIDIAEKKTKRALLISFPRYNQNGKDTFFEAFLTPLKDAGFECIRIELPYYFQMTMTMHEYVMKYKNAVISGCKSYFYDNYYTRAKQASHAAFYDEFKEKLSCIAISEDFSRHMAHNRVSLMPIFEAYFLPHVVSILATAASALDVTKDIINDFSPDMVMSVYENGSYARSFNINAMIKKIPSIGLQHGHGEQACYYMPSGAGNEQTLGLFPRYTIPLRTFVAGEYSKIDLTQNGTYPHESVEVLCDWQSLDVCQLPEKNVYNKKTVAILTSFDSSLLNEYILKLICPQKYEILLRLHPQETRFKEWSSFFHDNGYTFYDYKNLSAYQAIVDADVVWAPITSTVVVEALAQNKIVFAVKTNYFSVPWNDMVLDLNNYGNAQEFEHSVSCTPPSHNMKQFGFGTMDKVLFGTSVKQKVLELCYPHH